MLVAQSGQMADALVVLRHQPGSNQKCLDHLADRASRQSQPRRQDVEPLRTFGQHVEILLLVRPEPDRVDLFKLARSLKMTRS